MESGMSWSIILLVLGAALLHAAWNIIVKGGQNKLFETAMNALGGGLGAMLILPFLHFPDRAAWGLLALSCACHLTYYICIAAAYRVADLSLGYTIMRGTAPMLTALALCLMGVPLGLAGWGGVLLLCAGIFTLALEQKLSHKGSLKGILYALRTSFVIMGYTLADGYGARLSGDSLSYTCWIFFLNIFPLHIYVCWRHGREYLAYLRKRATIGIGGGLCGLGSYGIAIWAMTMAPIALVAALRETSVIFAMIMAVIFLGEKLTPLRILAIFLVMAGAMIVRLG
jgi:drug/metabolite transporter (DMT)-like permease